MSSKLSISLIVLALIVGLLGGQLLGGHVQFGVGGVQYDKWYFRGVTDVTQVNSLSANGSTETQIIDANGNYTGAVSSTATSSFLGNASLGNTALVFAVTTSSPTSTLTGAQECYNGVIRFNPNGASGITTGTITFAPATSTNATCLLVDGSSHSFVVNNLGGNQTSSITFASTTLSSGITLMQIGTSTAGGLFNVSGTRSAIVTVTRDTSSTNLIFFQQPY